MLNHWSNEETEYLEDKWGVISKPAIAKKLGRSVDAVQLKARRLGLTRHIHSGDYLTINQLIVALNRSYSYTIDQWTKKGLPVKTKISVRKRYKIIYLDEFWKWAKDNRTLIDFSKVEVGALGKEPEWVHEQRKHDSANKKYSGRVWTQTDDARLISMLRQFRFSYDDISKELNRSGGAIKRRIYDLKLKERPVKANNQNYWSENEILKLIELYNSGMSSDVIAEHLHGRSSLAIKGKLERLIKEGQLKSIRHLKSY